MVFLQKRSRRKPTGGRYKQLKIRRQHHMGREPAMTRVGPDRAKDVRTAGGNGKRKLLAASVAYVVDPATQKHAKATITTIRDNPANRHFIRRNIITKGAIIETDKGLARVTSRPGQDGVVFGVLIKE